MKDTTANKPSVIYIEQVENLYIHQLDLTPATHIYIEKVENLHMDKVKLATTVTHDDKPPTKYQEQPTSHPETATSPPLTLSHLALACYYVLTSWGIQPRVKLDIAHVARFMHLVTSKPYTRIQNSEFYKKLQRVPQLKSNKELIKDLAFIKDRFLQLELKEASLLVDRDLAQAHQKTNQRFK